LALLAAENLVVEMFEEVGIGFVGDADIRFMRGDTIIQPR
jgi:hypothetical protein